MKLRTVLAAALSLSVTLAPATGLAQPSGANPEDGTVAGGAYGNPYFDLRYPLPAGWTAGLQPPPPSYSGYYVLATPSPPPGAQATILVAAQDEFFAKPPLAGAAAFIRDFAHGLPAAVTIAGHPFERLPLPGAPLSRIVLATEIRCHVVIFTIAAAEPKRLEALARDLDGLSFPAAARPPACLKGYANPQTIRRRVEPVPAPPRFVAIPVRIVIGADGKVRHVHVIRAAAQQRRNLTDALLQWRFVPFLANGRPAAVETGLTFEFKRGG